MTENRKVSNVNEEPESDAREPNAHGANASGVSAAEGDADAVTRHVGGSALDTRLATTLLWTGVAATSVLTSPKWLVPAAAWLLPWLLLEITRRQNRWRGWLALWALQTIAGCVALSEVMPFPTVMLAIWCAIGTGVGLTPYVVDRWACQRWGPSLARSLVFPIAVTGLDFLSAFGPQGMWASPANTQATYVWLIQIVALAGPWGLVFMMHWGASTAAEARVLWNAAGAQGLRIVVPYSMLIGATLLGGIARCQRPSDAQVVRLGAVIPESLPLLVAGYEDASGERLELDSNMSQSDPRMAQAGSWLPKFLADPDRAKFPKFYAAREDYEERLFAATRAAAQRGATLVSWTEGAAWRTKEDEAEFVERARSLARAERVYLTASYVAFFTGTPRDDGKQMENKLILIGPTGEVLTEFFKNKPVGGVEPTVPGDGEIPVIETDLGRIAVSICYDADFPSHMRQVGRQRADLLVLPSGDWRAIAPYHSHMALMRGVENGAALFRPVSHGMSIAADSRGRIIAQHDSFQETSEMWIADLPVARFDSVYSKGGDWLGWFCVGTTAIVLATLVFGRRANAATALALALVVCGPCVVDPARAWADDADSRLPGTSPWTLHEPLDEAMVEGIRRHALRALEQARDDRNKFDGLKFTSIEAYAASLADDRRRFQTVIGAVDPRVTATRTEGRLSRFESIVPVGGSSLMARADQIEVHAVRWPVLDGVSAEGLLLVPREPRAAVVAIPESEWTPEAFCGIGGDVPETSQFPRRLAAAGCLVVVPLVLSRSDEFSGHADLGFTNQSHREVVYRQAFVVGRHLAGYEVQAALAAADLLSRWNGLEPSSEAPRKPLPLGIAGVGEGGRLALYAAALDVRFESTLVSGYFGPRDKVWREPLDRNVWRLLTEFGDAELARLIAPRRLTIEASRCAQVVGPRSPRPGRRASAAPGAIQTPALEAVLTEVDRARKVYERLDREDSLEVETSGEEDGGAGASRAFTCFLQGLKLTPALEPSGATWRMEEKGSAESRARRMIDRERRYFEQLQQHVQGLVRRSSSVRDAMWSMDTLTAEAWPARREKLARETRREFLGELSDPLLPLQVESRRVSETATETVYEVRLEVVPDVIAGGMLVMPKTLTPDVRHPLVVCQHGLESLASDTLASEGPGYSYYKAFSVALARRGYMVFAPQNPYRGGDRFREIQRMTNPLGRTLFSYIIAQHEQLLRWLATLPQVDSRRMAFYGLSYGGKTALRVPPFVEAYSAVICSGDFTDWARAVGANDEKSGYLFTSEYEIPEWNMANRASHAELALLIAPRPFMVEAGYRDSGQPPEWVAAEFSKVRRGYERLGIGSRAELEFFDGPHTIHGEGTFRFLDRHLKSR